MKYNVVEIFDSIEGEGVRSGLPATFIRLAGCNLQCSYCDTKYAWFDDTGTCEYSCMTLEEVMAKVNRNYNRITLTGGEPLVSKNIEKLASRLLQENFEVNIETNGSVDINEFMSKLELPYSPECLFFTIDYKLMSSGVNGKMIGGNFTKLRPIDAIKFVVGSDEDFEAMVDFVKLIKPLYSIMPNILVGAVYGVYDLKKLAAKLIATPILCDTRLQVQLHKIIWGQDKRGV